MESPIEEQYCQSQEVQETYAYVSISPSYKVDKKLSDLNRNVLEVICEYLEFYELTNLSSSNKRIKCRLDNFQGLASQSSYFKRRAIVFFQSFFFQQFPINDFIFERMSQVTSTISTSASSSSFLPLMKQSSVISDKQRFPPLILRQTSYNPFEIAKDVKQMTASKGLIQTNSYDTRSNNYIEKTYQTWRSLYCLAFENKEEFVSATKDQFYSVFVQDANDYAREMFLDPSLCENASFALPQLTRENYAQKGLFYRTEKVIVHNFYNCFQKNSVDYTKQLLWDVNQSMIEQVVSSSDNISMLKNLLRDPSSVQNSDKLFSSQDHPVNPDELDPLLDFDPNDMGNLDELELALSSLPVSISKNPSSFGVEQSKLVRMIAPKSQIQNLYHDVSAYTLKQFKLLCYAHKKQLDFILQQLQMAPQYKTSFYIFIEDYVLKERNLKFMLRKISQNFIVQEAFQETVLANHIFKESFTSKHSYAADFLLLEMLDSIWINEIYIPHMSNLVELTQQEVREVHSMERYHELSEKQKTFKKVMNLVNQMDFNLTNNQKFLSISAHQSLDQFSVLSDGKVCESKYDDFKSHVRASVKALLKQFQQSSLTLQEFIGLCTEYEHYGFQKLEELEHFYIVTKRYYIAKMFSKEISQRLEDNLISRSPGGSSPSAQKTYKSSFDVQLNLNQLIHQELVESFFHCFLRELLRDEKFKEFMPFNQVMEALFVLFHIDPSSKSHFASHINQLLIESQEQLDDLKHAHPEDYAQVTEEAEESKSELADEKNISGPLNIIASDDDDEVIENLSMPQFQRAFSEQKRQRQKDIRRCLFRIFQETAAVYDFDHLIQAQKALEKKRMMDEIQERINSFNRQLQQQMPSAQDIDEDDLPDPSSLMSFGGPSHQPVMSQNTIPFSYNLGTQFVKQT